MVPPKQTSFVDSDQKLTCIIRIQLVRPTKNQLLPEYSVINRFSAWRTYNVRPHFAQPYAWKT